MRAIGVNEDSMVVICVVSIAADVGPTIDHQGSLTELSDGSFGVSQAAETGSDDHVVEFPWHNGKS